MKFWFTKKKKKKNFNLRSSTVPLKIRVELASSSNA